MCSVAFLRCAVDVEPFAAAFGLPFGSADAPVVDAPGDVLSELFSGLLLPGDGGATLSVGVTPTDPGGRGGGLEHDPGLGPTAGGSAELLGGFGGGDGGGGAGGGGLGGPSLGGTIGVP